MNLRYLAVAVPLLLAACAGTQPIYEVRNHPVPAQARSLPLDRIESAIVDAGKTRNWRFERVRPGELHARQERSSYYAELAITFDANSYSITRYSSSGMRETETGEISGHYNMWVKTLEKDIDIQLSNAMFSK
jgi:hypothetical protein